MRRFLRAMVIVAILVVLAGILPAAAIHRRYRFTACRGGPAPGTCSPVPGPGRRLIARLIQRAATRLRRWPGVNCLTLAISVSWLLRVLRVPHRLCVGVATGAVEPFVARPAGFISHAWLQLWGMTIPVAEERNGLHVIWARQWP